MLFRWLYSLILAEDANFKQKSRLRSCDSRDPALGPGWATFVNDDAYHDHLSKQADVDEVCDLVLYSLLSNVTFIRSTIASVSPRYGMQIQSVPRDSGPLVSGLLPVPAMSVFCPMGQGIFKKANGGYHFGHLLSMPDLHLPATRIWTSFFYRALLGRPSNQSSFLMTSHASGVEISFRGWPKCRTTSTSPTPSNYSSKYPNSTCPPMSASAGRHSPSILRNGWAVLTAKESNGTGRG